MLTDREVLGFVKANRGQRAEVTVGGAPGLVARVAQDGALTYALRYRNRGGKQRTLTLGALTLGRARDHAKDLLAEARTGVDPWEARRGERMAEEESERAQDRTLTKVVGAWLASRDAAGWRPATRRGTELLMQRRWLPVFGDRDPNGLTRAEVRRELDAIEDRAPSEARHAFVALRGLYNWLAKERQEHLGVRSNPTTGMEKPGKAVERSRTYSDDEVRRILDAVRGTPVEDHVTLLFYTGTRDTETRSMRWPDVDMDRALWTIPAEVSKNGRPHAVSLSSGALAVLRRRPRFGEFVFANPATATGYAERSSKELRAVSIAAGLLNNVGTKKQPKWEGEGLRLHDIRRTVGDRLQLQFKRPVMHAALGHADAALTRIYGPSPNLKELAEAMEWWAGEVARILEAKEKWA